MDATFDHVDFTPDTWRHYTKGDTIYCDDLGACTDTARFDGWYYLEARGLGSYSVYYAPSREECFRN